MPDVDTLLIIITCLVGIVSITAVQIKKGIVMGSIWSQLGKESAKKYVERRDKKRVFYLYLCLASTIVILTALLFMRDLEARAIFTILNLLFIGYFLNYFVLLEPKD